MKRKKQLYVLLSALVLGALIYFLITMHTPFRWAPTFEHDSKEPFGCALFDSLMAKTFQQGYEVQQDLPDSLDPKRDAILYCKFNIGSYSHYYENYEPETERAKKLMNFAKKGGKVIVATIMVEEGYNNDTLLLKAYDLRTTPNSHYHSWLDYSYLTDPENAIYRNVAEMKKEKLELDTLTWLADGKIYKVNRLLTANTQLPYHHKNNHPKLMKGRRGKDQLPMAFTRNYKSGGTVEYVATPLFFTNYAVMDEEAVQLSLRLLYPVRDRHVIRILGKNPTKDLKSTQNRDQFSFLRRHRSLRYAFYLILVTLSLFMFFGARRKMRSIPLLPKERNMTLDFARFMGTFHYRRHDYKQVLLSQYELMLHALGETMYSDVNRLTADELQQVLEEKTRLPRTEIRQLVQTAEKLKQTDMTISQQDMMHLLDVIRDVKKCLLN